MEKLEITNFLSIEKAEIEIKKLNIFIGPQAQGKSVIAKLIYFFKEYPQSIFDSVYQGEEEKYEFDKKILAKFEQIFPSYTWKKAEFVICYSNSHYSISICNNKISDSNFRLKLGNDERLDLVFSHLIEKYKQLKIANSKYKYSDTDLLPNLYSGFIDELFVKNKYRYLEEAIYIPAGRSFFATVKNNIFSLINSDIQIDYFLTKFGRHYEFIKNNDFHVLHRTTRDAIDDLFQYKEPPSRKENLVRQLIGGEFISEKGEDWIVNEQGKINIVDSSSGQQEALPIAIFLSKKLDQLSRKHNGSIVPHFIIEEPEAHLFPVAQSQIVSLIALVYNDLMQQMDYSLDEQGEIDVHDVFFEVKNTFTITTHSPYIITAFNNLIQAGNVAASKNHQNLEELYKVVPESEIVDFNDVTAYIVDQGTVKSILNRELKLIDANMIDEISEHFADTFEKLLGMEEMNG